MYKLYRVSDRQSACRCRCPGGREQVRPPFRSPHPCPWLGSVSTWRLDRGFMCPTCDHFVSFSVAALSPTWPYLYKYVGRGNGDVEIWNVTNDWHVERVLPGGDGISVEAMVWTANRLFSAGWASTTVTLMQIPCVECILQDSALLSCFRHMICDHLLSPRRYPIRSCTSRSSKYLPSLPVVLGKQDLHTDFDPNPM